MGRTSRICIKSPKKVSVLPDLNRPPLGAQTNLRTAFAYGSAGGGIPVAVVYSEIEVALDIAVVAFRIHLEAGISRHLNDDLAAAIINVNFAQRSFQM